jgi:hypothetical protein
MMAATDHPTEYLRWFKSSYSGGAGSDCVEVALGKGTTGIRDSKVTQGSVLAVSADAFTAFLSGVKGYGLRRTV